MLKHSVSFLCILFIPVIVLFFPGKSFSQHGERVGKKTFFSNISIGSRFHYGSFLTTRAKAEYIRDSYSTFGEFFIEFQTDGTKNWHATHKNPQWGISFLSGNSGSRQYIGNMSALYAYLNNPLLRTRNYKGSFMIGAGPGWVSKPYDIYANPKNTLIGTRLNAFIFLGWQNELRLSERIFLSGSLNLMHLSNGGITLPNLGLNIPSLSAGLRYAFAKPFIEKRDPPDSFRKKTGFAIYTTVGLKQAPRVAGNHYLINGLQAEISKRVSRNYAYGAGVLLLYNRSLSHFPFDYPGTAQRNNKKIQAGIYAAYEHFFGKLSLPLHAGAHVYNKDKSAVFFQQFGIRFQVSKKISTELLLKSQMGKAEFIHTGFGFNF